MKKRIFVSIYAVIFAGLMVLGFAAGARGQTTPKKPDDAAFDFREFSWDDLNFSQARADAQADIDEGRYDDAIKKMDKEIAANPDGPLSLELRGRAYYFKRDLIAALEDTEKAIGLKPDLAYALCTRALIERTRTQDGMSQKDFAQAIVAANKMVSDSPKVSARYYERAEIYRLKGDRENALADYKKAIEFGPEKTLAKKRVDQIAAGKVIDPVIKEDRCLDTKFFTIDARSFSMAPVLIEADEINRVVAACDRSITESPAAFKYLQRGLARYYLIYGTSLSLGASLLDAGNVDKTMLPKALADLKSYLDDPIAEKAPTDLKLAFRASGELNAISGAITKTAEPFQLSLKQLNTAFQIKVPPPDLGIDPDKIILEDRTGIQSYLKLNPSIKPAGADDVAARFQKYMADYKGLEPAYRKNVADFQESVKAAQASPNSGTVQVCSNLSAMNSSYRALKTAFSKIVEMKNNGELSNDSNAVRNVEATEAVQIRVQGNIDANAAKYGCKLN